MDVRMVAETVLVPEGYETVFDKWCPPGFKVIRVLRGTSAAQPWDRWVARALSDLHQRHEEYVRAWIAETGLHPTECELVERHNADSSITVTVQRKAR